MGKKGLPLVRSRNEPRKTNLRNIANLAQLALNQKQDPNLKKLNNWTNKINMKEVIESDDEDEDGYSDRIEEVPTTCYGDVEFRGATRRARAKFVRLSDETDPQSVYDLMIDGWKMEKPRLLISIIGGVESFNLDSTLKANFTSGLSKIAQTTGAWVISAGTNSGVGKHVGDSLQGSCKQCIGILPWGVINSKDELEPSHEKKDGKYSYDVGCWLTDSSEKKVYLDSNHTHFLLVDDGTSEFGCDISFRRKLEKFIIRGNEEEVLPKDTKDLGKILQSTTNTEPIPSVLLVVEGNFDTLRIIHNDVCGDDPIPTVLVKESGGTADLLIYAISNVDEIMAENLKGKRHAILEGHICETFNISFEDDEEQIEIAYDYISELIKHTDMFSVDLPQVAIDDAILTALINDRNTGPFRQLQLTLVWDRADLARELVLSNKIKWEGDPKELNWIMIMALAMDNVEFVKLLLDYGVSISSFLTNEVLEFLHGYRSYNKNSPLRYEISEKEYKMYHMSGINTNIYNFICVYNQLHTHYVAIPRKVIEKAMQDLCSGLVKIEDEKFIEDLRLSKQDLSERLALLNLGNFDLDQNLSIRFKYPFRELFFWAVLNNMTDMALFLWQFEEEHMAKALIAAELSRELLNRRENQEELEKSLSEGVRIFKALAVQLLDQCYKRDEAKTQRLLTSSFNQFPGVNNLNLAVNSDNLEFVSHSSVQVLLNDVWTGNMKIREVSLTDITLAMIFPFLINKFEFRTEEEIKTMVKTDDTDEIIQDVDDDDDDDDGSGDDDGLEDRDVFGPNLTRKSIGTQLPFYKKCYQFYMCTPVVKFLAHVMSYFIFLALYSYVAMLKKKDTTPFHLEYLLIITVFAYLIAEIYQVIQVDAQSVKARLLDWMSSEVNIFDGFIIGLFFIALSFRLDENYRDFGHLLYAIDCGLWILRLLTVFFVNPTLGPYLVMIKKMLKDLMIFMAVLFIVLLAYGVTSAAILNPTDNPTDIKMLSNPIWQPYFNIYGLMLVDRDLKEGENKTRFGTDYHTAYDETIVWVLMGIYLLMTNILLLNLLIAVFNNTYNDVASNSSQFWKYQRHSLIMEYSQRSPAPPPFSLFNHSFIFFRWIYRQCIGKKRKEYAGLKSYITQKEKDELIEFECNCVTQVTRKNNVGEKKNNEELTTDLLDEMEALKGAVSMLEARLKVTSKKDESKETKDIKTRIEKRSSSINIIKEEEAETSKEPFLAGPIIEEPILEKPIPAEPVTTERTRKESIITEPIPEEPILIEPIPTEPILIEPIPTEPIITEPIPTEPIITEPIPTEPIITEPIPTEPIITEPIPTEPIITESVPAEPHIEPILTEPILEEATLTEPPAVSISSPDEETTEIATESLINLEP